MKSNDTRPWWSCRGSWALLSLLFVFACGGSGDSGCSGGCDCTRSTPYPATAPAVQQGIQVRVSEPGFDFVEDNLDGIIGQFMAGGMTFCIPEDPSQPMCNVRTCPSTGETGCELSLELTDVQIDTAVPARVQIDLTIGGMNPDEDFIEVTIDPLNTGLADCIVRLDTQGDGLPAQVFIDFIVDPVTGDVSVKLDPDSIVIDFDQLDLSIDWQENGDIIGCGGLNLLTSIGFVRDLIYGAVDGMLGDFIGPATTGLLCQGCVDSSGCPAGTECTDVDGSMVCFDAATSACVPTMLGVETVLDLGAMMSSFSPGLEAELYVQVKAHNLAESIEHGLTLGMRGGTYADKAECVPVVPPPLQLDVPTSTLLEGNVDPTGAPFHVGIGVSKAYMDEALWGMFNSGGLCLSVGPEVSDMISTGTFGALMPSLRQLTGGANSPMFINLEPSLPPTVVIGAGTIDPDSGEIIEPLLEVHWDNLDITFLAFFDERYVRILTINTDLVVPLAIDPTEEGLVIVLGDLTNAFARIEARDTELLTESPEQLETLIPALVAVALPALGDSLSSPIAIPEFSGFNLEVTGLTGIEGDSMMGIFANLALAPTGQNQVWRPVDTTVELVDVHLPPARLTQPSDSMTEEERAQHLMASRPVLTLKASSSYLGTELGDGEVQYSYRVDGGLWSTFRRESTLVLDEPIFLLQAVHTVEVRSRLNGLWGTLDPSPASVEVPIDFEDPTVEFMQHGNLVSLLGSDAVTGSGGLDYSLRVDGGQWSSWTGDDQIDLRQVLPAGTPSANLEVRVRDAAGRIGTARRSFAVHAEVTPAKPAAEDGCSCNTLSSTRPTGSAWIVLSLIGLGLVLARRKRHPVGDPSAATTAKIVVALLLGLGIAGSGCTCDEDTGAGPPCGGGCEHGKVCIDGVCENRTDCETDGDCAVEALCVEGQCFEDACRTDDDCVEGVCLEVEGIGHKRCVSAACSEDAECVDQIDCGPRTPFCAESTGQCQCPEPCSSGCGAGTYCCEQTDSCDALPDPCTDFECPSGFGPSVVTEASGQSATCEVTRGVCECVELPPLDEGIIGRYSDSVVVGDKILLSAYNDTYGDLMFGSVGAGDAIAWTFLDGVPQDGAVTGTINGPRGGVSTVGDDVGRFTSIAADSTGNVMIAYHDVTHGSLKFALGVPMDGSYAWQIFTLDTEGDAGWFTDLSVGPTDIPAIASMTLHQPNADDGVPTATSKLRWFQAPSSVPDETGWVATDLDVAEVSFACQGGCEGSDKCRLDTNLCQGASPTADCGDSCAAEERCFEGVCAPIALDALSDLPAGVGLFASVDRYADGSPAVAYYDRTGGDLRFVQVQDGTWTEPVILDGRNPDGTDAADVGAFCDLFIDDADAPHIAYVDSTRSDLRLLDVAAATSEVVDAGLRIEPGKVNTVLVGDDASILMDATGNLRIAYQDATSHQLLLARQAGAGWELITLAGDEGSYAGSFGFYINQLQLGDESVVTSFKYNRQTDPDSSGIAIVRF